MAVPVSHSACASFVVSVKASASDCKVLDIFVMQERPVRMLTAINKDCFSCVLLLGMCIGASQNI